MDSSSFVISRDDWSLHRKGILDQQRHQEKVKEAIKNNLAEIVSEESIIMSDGKKIVKVPIRSIEQFRFRFNYNKQQHVGQGKGNSMPGDLIAQDKSGKGQKSSGAGNEPGNDYYEAEITIDELAEIIFEDLGLPNLEQKSKPDVSVDSYKFNDVRKKGITGNLDKKRTIIENIKRNAREGKKGVNKFLPEDLRYKTWDEEYTFDTSAVVLAMMDTSGSMGPFEKYIARSFFFWMLRFLRTKYKNVKVVFLAHHTEAKEVTEEEFFTKGESGGTRCSSVYELALEIIEKRYPPSDFNIYPFHFSDGDNLPSDNAKCVELVQKLLEVGNLFGYGEIEGLYYNYSSLMSVFKKINDPKFTCVTIRDKAGVYPALKTFFSPKHNL